MLAMNYEDYEEPKKTNVELNSDELQAFMRFKEIESEKEKEESENKKNRENPPFVQVYKGKGFKALQWLTNENPVGASILMFFMDNMNNQNSVMASQQLLTEVLGKGRTTIYNSIKFLDEHNFIEIGKVGTANVYIINPEIAFQASHDKKKFISFSGTILLSKNENEKLFKKYKHDNIKVLKEK